MNRGARNYVRRGKAPAVPTGRKPEDGCRQTARAHFHRRPGIAELPFTVSVGASLMLLVDAPRLIQLGPVTLSGAITLLVAALTICLLPSYFVSGLGGARPLTAFQSPSRSLPWSLWAFLLLLSGSLAMTLLSSGISSETIQNACAYLTFVGAIAFAAAATPPVAFRGWELMQGISTWFAYIALAITVVEQIVAPGTVDNTRFVFTPRSMAMVGVIALAIVIPGTPRNHWQRFAPFALIIAMALSLSRTCTIVGLAMMVFFVLRANRTKSRKTGGRLFRSFFVAAVITGCAYLLVAYYTPFRNRFLVGDNAWDVGDVAISSQGRAKLWQLLLSNSYDGWLLGHGVGAASRLVAENTRLNHPHNEYLRLYFDFGIAGLILFLASLAALALITLRSARRTDHPVHWAALIAVIGIALVAVTDNPFVYPFVMLPLGSLIGLSLALSGLSWRESRCIGTSVVTGLSRTVNTGS